MLLVLERCSRSPSASAATAGGAGGWYSPAARACATAASTAVSKVPRETVCPPTVCRAWKRFDASSGPKGAANSNPKVDLAAELLRRFEIADVTRACVTGASGINFALKAYLSALEPGDVSMWGFVIPGKFAAAAELLIIHLLNPHAPSLVYHLVGLAVGVVFAAGKKARDAATSGDVLGRLREAVGKAFRGSARR